MRRLTRFLPLLAAILILLPALPAAELSVRVEDSLPGGQVVIQLFDSADAFGDLRDPIRTERFPVAADGMYLITGIPAGEYALLVFHDENENDLMDRNFIGIPREPVAFSNDYRPQGPPSYSRAAFTVADDEARTFNVRLQETLGKRGRFGVGLGILARSSPYRDYDGAVVRVIPALSYVGERFQIFGPVAQYNLTGNDHIRLAAVARYRMGVYDEEDSDFLEGMGDREDTLTAGLSLLAELPAGFELSLGYQHDVLDKFGGGEARLELERSFQSGIWRLTPSLALNAMTADTARHDYGVPASAARPGRPAYDPGEAYSLETGFSLSAEITREWFAVLSIAAEFLDDSLTDSPIVEDSSLLKGFAAVNYLF